MQCLLKPGESQMGFGENASHAEYDGAAFARSIFGFLEQRRFANSSSSADEESSPTLIDPVEKLIDERDFRFSSQQKWRAGSRDTIVLLLPGQRGFFQPFRHLGFVLYRK